MSHYQLKTHIPFLVERVAALAREAVAPVMREHDLTLPMWRVLASLYDDGERTMGQLLVATSLEQSTLSRSVAALARRGFVTRRPTRPATFSLLARGRAMSQRLLPHVTDAHTTMVAGVDPGDLDVFTRVLDQLYHNISRCDNTPTARMRLRVAAVAQ